MKADGIAAFSGLVDLASAAIGGQALIASDDFFASKDNLVKPAPAVFDPDAFTDRGKEMDGWESRRKRVPGHDWAIVKLGVAGQVRGFDIDTSHFLGNHPPYASIDGARIAGDATPEQIRDTADWTPILSEVGLAPGSHNLFAAEAAGPFTHVRLNIFPDGGVARLRVFGEPRPSQGALSEAIDLAAVENGGRAVAASDMFFGGMQNLVMPGRPVNMGQGWETRRRRGTGNDWIVVRLGQPGTLDRLVVDTTHFKGNFPDRVAVEGLYWPDAPISGLLKSDQWSRVLAPTRLRPDDERVFDTFASAGPFTHLRVHAIPCGGIARLRAWGRRAAPDIAEDTVLATINGPDQLAEQALSRCCGAKRWVAGMLRARPFTSRAALFGLAEAQWWRLGDGDWLEAFTHHPRIGSDLGALRDRFAATAELSEGEQAGVRGADLATLRAFAEANRAYEDRFGTLFIVSAAGKSATEMLAILNSRLENTPENELRIAAGEQAKITRLRLEKLGS